MNRRAPPLGGPPLGGPPPQGSAPAGSAEPKLRESCGPGQIPGHPLLMVAGGACAALQRRGLPQKWSILRLMLRWLRTLEEPDRTRSPRSPRVGNRTECASTARGRAACGKPRPVRSRRGGRKVSRVGDSGVGGRTEAGWPAACPSAGLAKGAGPRNSLPCGVFPSSFRGRSLENSFPTRILGLSSWRAAGLSQSDS